MTIVYTEFWIVEVKNDLNDPWWGISKDFSRLEEANSLYDKYLTEYKFVRLRHYKMEDNVDKQNFVDEKQY
jgi:hypothetical protein